jgi:hypothetical protein
MGITRSTGRTPRCVCWCVCVCVCVMCVCVFVPMLPPHSTPHLSTPPPPFPQHTQQIFDADLTALGVEQAVALRPHLAGLGIELAVTSPLRRACRRFHHLLQHHRPYWGRGLGGRR